MTNIISKIKEEVKFFNDYIQNDEDLSSEKKKEFLFDIPEIVEYVVVGEENSGKSSLLENITGYEIFPKSEEICTKRPVRVRFRRDDKNSGYYINGVSQSSISDVRSKLTVLFNQETKLKRDKEIIVRIEGDFPEFDIVDLPGIQTTSIDSMVNSNEMITSYTKNDNYTIFLCTIPTDTTHIDRNPAFHIVQQFEPNYYLILTKPDLIHSNLRDYLFRRVSSKPNQKERCHCILNQNETKQKEEEYFNSLQAIYKNTLDELGISGTQFKDRVGSPSLISSLSTEYVEYVSIWCVENYKNYLKNNKAFLEMNLKNLGDSQIHIKHLVEHIYRTNQTISDELTSDDIVNYNVGNITLGRKLTDESSFKYFVYQIETNLWESLLQGKIDSQTKARYFSTFFAKFVNKIGADLWKNKDFLPFLLNKKNLKIYIRDMLILPKIEDENARKETFSDWSEYIQENNEYQELRKYYEDKIQDIQNKLNQFN